MIWLFTFFGFLLRFWKLEYGLPSIFFIDEGHYVYWALNIGKDLRPPVFLEPTLYFYLSLLGNGFYIAAKLASGSFQSLSDAWQLYKTNPTIYYWIGRAVSALLGTLTIPVLYSGVKRLFGRPAAKMAAFFLTFAFLHVQYSQIGYLDASLTFFITLSFSFGSAGVKKGRSRDFILAGLAGGLAASTKFTGFAALLFGPAASLLAEKKDFGKIFRQNLIFFACFIAGFTAGTPYWLIAFNEFKQDLFVMIGDYKTGGRGHFGYEGKWNWFHYLREPLRYGLGLPLQIAGLIGIVFAAVRANRKTIFLISFPLAYFFVIGISDIRQARYMVAVIPFLCAAAAHAVSAFRLRPAGKWGLAALLILPSLISVTAYNYLKTRPDTRELAHLWIKENLSSDTRILQSVFAFVPKSGGETQSAYLDITAFDTRLHHQSSLKTLEEYRQEGWQYLVLDDWQPALLMNGAKQNPRYSETGKKYEEFLAALQSGGAKSLAVFLPADSDLPVDVENVEFTSKGLLKLKRLGPKITIYQL